MDLCCGLTDYCSSEKKGKIGKRGIDKKRKDSDETIVLNVDDAHAVAEFLLKFIFIQNLDLEEINPKLIREERINLIIEKRLPSDVESKLITPLDI